MLLLSFRHLLNTLDPLVLLLLSGGRHPVHSVLPLHHLPLAVSLAGFDNLNELSVNIDPSNHVKLYYLISLAEELKAVRLAPVGDFPDLEIQIRSRSSLSPG